MGRVIKEETNMKHQNTKQRYKLLLSFIIVALFPLWGCGIADEGTPETAKIVLEGGGGETFQLITTTDFDITADQDGQNRDIFIYSADTTTVSAPYTKSYSLGPRVRFYLKAFSIEELSQPLTVKLLIDGEQRYKATSTLAELSLEFNYTFR